MNNIRTNENIISTVNLKSTGLNVGLKDRWEIKYVVVETSLFGANVLSTSVVKTVVISDTPEQPIFDEDGNVTGTTPATTDLTEFFAAFSTQQELLDLSLERCIDHAGLVEFVDPTDDLLDDPTATDVKPWVANEVVVLTMKREYQGIIYDVVQPHTTLPTWTPDVTPALWTVSQDQGGSEGYPEWVQPVGSSDAYLLGAKVHYSVTGLCYENTGSNANVWSPVTFGWTVIPCI